MKRIKWNKKRPLLNKKIIKKKLINYTLKEKIFINWLIIKLIVTDLNKGKDIVKKIIIFYEKY